MLAQNDRASLQSVTAIRNWSLSDVTRIAIEVSGDFKFRTDRLHNPERVYFDILNARPRIDARRIWSNQINDKLVQRVRVAETSPGTTRVVVDLTGPVEISTSQLSSPYRLIIEMRPGRRFPAYPFPVAAASGAFAESRLHLSGRRSPSPWRRQSSRREPEPRSWWQPRPDSLCLRTEPEPLPNKLATAPPARAKAATPPEPSIQPRNLGRYPAGGSQ